MLKPEQKSKVCYEWDYMDPKRGLLRTRVANNWKITEEEINSDFYTSDQQAVIKDIFEGPHPARLAQADLSTARMMMPVVMARIKALRFSARPTPENSSS